VFLLTEEQNTFRARVREIVEKHFKPRASFIDENRCFPRKNVKILTDNNLFGLNISKDYGGQGLDSISQAIAIEEVARVCVSTSILLTNQVLIMSALKMAGSQQQREEILPKLATGQMLGAGALTERVSGSDMSNIKTQARKHRENYLINGLKCFVTNAGEMDYYLVSAKTDMRKGHQGMSLFIIEKGKKGLTFGKIEKTMGLRGVPMKEVVLNNCAIPVSNIVGEEEEGFQILAKSRSRQDTLGF